MENRGFAVLCLTLLAVVLVPAQPGPGGLNPGNAPKGTITGQVFDDDLNQPVEYANIVLYRQRDSSQVTGTVTRADGRFILPDVPPGRFYLDISFIGYRDKRIPDLQLSPGAKIDIGRQSLRQVAVAVEGVEARAEKPELTYRIDKKVIEVAGRPNAEAGTAVEVLENVPSVKVDIEGTVTLRGSENFKVLIDGRPSPLEPSDALQSVPSATIDRIELITNPSAKYDPEGVAGIVNVILKKQRGSGLSGVVNANGGSFGRFGGDALVSWRSGKVGLFVNGGYNRRRNPAEGVNFRETWRVDSTGDTLRSYLRAEGENMWGGQFYNIRGGGDVQWTESDRTGLSARIGGRDFGNSRDADYSEWAATGTDTLRYVSTSSGNRGGGFYMGTLDHQHKFAGRDGHELTATAEFSLRTGRDTTLTELRSGDVITTGQRTIEAGPGGRAGFQADYALPLRSEDRLEAGYSVNYHADAETTYFYEYDTTAAQYVFRDEYSYAAEFNEAVHALYATYSADLGKFGVKPGLRVEYDDRSTATDGVVGVQVREFGLFPSIHFSYDLPGQQQLMASYVRRIDRPRGWSLQPGIRRFDPYNAMEGNPALKPENINSFELGYQVPFGPSRVSVEGYLRTTENLIQRYTRVDSVDPRVLIGQSRNVGSDRSLGVELLADLNPAKFININLTGTFYDYRLETGEGTVKTSFNWDGRLTAELRLPTMTRIQLIGDYESPSVTAQGTSGGEFGLNAAVRQALFDRRLSIALQARDLLGTNSHEFTSRGDGFYSSMSFNRAWPVFSLSLTYNFNNYRPDRRRRDTGDSEMMDEGEGNGF
jgi:outer membrane receptor protein involved in Fe transport